MEVIEHSSVRMYNFIKVLYIKDPSTKHRLAIQHTSAKNESKTVLLLFPTRIWSVNKHIASYITSCLSLNATTSCFHSDSPFVLGYVSKTTRRPFNPGIDISFDGLEYVSKQLSQARLAVLLPSVYAASR